MSNELMQLGKQYSAIFAGPGWAMAACTALSRPCSPRLLHNSGIPLGDGESTTGINNPPTGGLYNDLPPFLVGQLCSIPEINFLVEYRPVAWESPSEVRCSQASGLVLESRSFGARRKCGGKQWLCLI